MNLQRFRGLSGWQAYLLVVVVFGAALLVAGESVNLILFAVVAGGFLQMVAWGARRLYARSRERR